LLIVCLALARPGASQTTGIVAGTVTDSSGAPLRGALLTASGPSLPGTRGAVSRANGTFRIPALPPGVYWVRATLFGFEESDRQVTVALDGTTSVVFALELAREEAVVVTGEAPVVDTSSTTAGTSYRNELVARLPVGRNYAEIVRSSPGVNTDLGETQGRSLALTVYGATSAENQWITDGINTTNVIKGIQGKAINVEFVDEVEVKSGGYPAEYGRALGGVVNVITKSGGNEYHGDLFGYYDSSATKAPQLVGPDDSREGMRVADYTRTDVGADLGGFLVRDRLWLFGAYDHVATPASVSRYESTPAVPASRRFPLDTTDELFSGKLTWNAAPGTTLVATAFSDPTTTTGAAAADPRQGKFAMHAIASLDPGTWEADRRVGGADVGVRGTQLFGSTALLSVQASRHRDRYELTPAGAASSVRVVDRTCKGGTAAAPCQMPLNPNSITGGFGIVYGPTNDNESRRDQLRGDLALYVGNHELKAGGDYQDATSRAVTSYSGGQQVTVRNERGQLYYIHTFYAASPTDLTPVDNVVAPRTRDYGLFVEDTWKPATGWTVSAGLRWDEEDVKNYRGASVLKTAAEWQPRLGVVWDPRGDGSSKITAFFGRFFYALPTDLSVRAYGAQTYANTFNFDPVGVVQDPGVLGHEKAAVQGGSFGEPVDPNLGGIFQDELTLGAEKRLSSSLSLGLRATYRRLGRAIEDRCDLNGRRPETNFNTCGLMNPGSDGPIARGEVPGCNGLDGNAGACTETIPAVAPARRLYRGVEVLVRKTVSTSLWLQASYVFSSLRGNYDGEVKSDGQTDPGINSDFDYPALFHDSYGRLFLDRPHSFRVDGVYETPFKLGIGVQGYVRSGAPLERRGYFNDLYGAVIQLDERGTAGRQPANWDASVTLSYPLQIRALKVTFQAYVLNVFDNQRPTTQDSAWSTQPPAAYPASLFDASQPSSNADYGKITGRQQARLFRAAVRVSF
jgi:hypothetical protein